MRVVDDVILNKPVVAVVDSDAPLRCAIDGVADQRELITIGRRLPRSKVMVEMNRVTSDLIGPQSPDLSLVIELRVIQYSHLRASHLAHFHETQVDFSARHENHMTARA